MVVHVRTAPVEVTSCQTPPIHSSCRCTRPAALPYRRLLVAGEVPLAAAVTAVLAAWQVLVGRGEMSEQTLSRFGQLLRRFEAFAAVRGAPLLADVDAAIAAQFIDAHGRTRHRHVAPASLSTRHLRRSVLRMYFATARRLALTDTDPTRDIDLPARLCGATRPLDEAEAVELRRAAQFTERPTRHAAAAALALAGGFSGEIGHIGPRDLDLTSARVWMHSSTKTQPRWCPLDAWAAQVLTARAHHILTTPPPDEPSHPLRLAVSSRNGTDEQIQARVCVALRDVLKRIGLGADPAVRPASITAYAGWETFNATGRIEAAARHLGMTSLDSTAALIGYQWRAETTHTTGLDGGGPYAR
ncbi:hypothetical protein [Streptomyces violaceusniger]|uniref:hypothetical protein n=1 Tax=Streptomyces violaceusniger TaxID=68280 RepID=UPI003683A844